MAAADVGHALAFLTKAKSTEPGVSVYDGLKAALLKVLEERPANPVEAMETTVFSKDLATSAVQPPLVQPSSAAAAARAVATANLFGTPEPVIDAESGEPIEPEAPNDYECEDVEGDGNLLDALGVGLGRAEMYAAMVAVKKLGEDSKRGVATVRFFGKFFGTQADYYVFETTLQSPPEMPEAPEGSVPYEPYGEGVNTYIYFVSSTLGGPVTQLPYATPEQVKASRPLRKFLTGKLDAPVSAYPAFPGTEANYLRALIARIASATVCCPKGYFLADEDASLSKDDEWVPLAGREMSLAVNWSHRYPHIKAQGRTAVYKRDPPDDDEEPEKGFWNAEEMEEGPQPLAALDRDAALPPTAGIPAGCAAWSSLASSAGVTTKNQVGGVRSNLWPGAAAACQGGHFTNIYVGWGLKAGPWAPAPPPVPAAGWAEALVESVELPPKPAPPEENEDE